MLKDKYRVIFDPKDAKKWCVELLDEAWKGIIYSYGQFSVVEPNDENSEPKFSYEIDVVYVPDRFKGVTFPDELEKPFRELLAQILLDILQDNLHNTKSTGDKLYLELSNDVNTK